MNCRECGQIVSADAVFCSACGSRLQTGTAAAHAESFKFHCPICGQKIAVKKEWGGRYATCPGCSNAIQIPEQTAIRQTAELDTKNVDSISGGEVKLAPRPQPVVFPDISQPGKQRPLEALSGKLRSVLHPGNEAKEAPAQKPAAIRLPPPIKK